MKFYTKIFLLGLLFVFVFALYRIIWRLPPTPVSQSASTPIIETVIPTASNLYKVIRVVDGDTIEIEGGEKVRYIGINAPESVAPNKPVGCFGHEASNKNKELVEGKMVRLEKDVSEKDKYGRLLRYVYLDNIFINDEMVREGLARVSTYPPDVKFQDQFRQSEKYARENNLGLWGKCNIK